MKPHRSLVSAACVFIVVVFAGFSFVRMDAKRHAAEQRLATEQLAVTQVYALERELQSASEVVRALAAEIRRRDSVDDFVSVAATVMGRAPNVEQLLVVAGNEIYAVYPARVESSGRDTLSVASWPEIPRADESHPEAPTLAGPTRLFGADGVIVRVPVAVGLSNSRKPLSGWVAAYLPLDRLLRSAGFDRLSAAGYDYELSHTGPRSRQPRAFSRSSTTELTSPVTQAIHRTDERWRLSLAPREGWLPWSSLLLHGALAGIFALSAAVLIYEMADKVARSREESDVRGQRLQQATQRLTEEIQQREELEKQFNQAGFHDALTGLPNRHYFIERLEHSLRRATRQPGYCVAVIVVDFDRLQNIKESIGHAAGDQLLMQASQRFESCLDSTDSVIARLGGDEIALLLFDIHTRDAAVAAAERLLTTMAEPFNLGHGDVFTAAGIGLALSTSGYEHAEELVRDANIALANAKAGNEARIAVFEAAARDRVVSSLQLETDLHRAIRQNEFRIHYQPIVSFATGRIVGMESLLRWEHPLEGTIMPDRFIGMAEETGLIVPITRWILRNTCERARAWRAQLPDDVEFYLSVNLSAHDLRQPDLADHVASLIQEMALPPGVLLLEVTEGSLISNVRSASDLVTRLRELCIPLMLDDFGTGYSSLSYLQRFQFDYLKIDRSFVSRIAAHGGNAGIVRAIIRLATDLGMKTVAEGVESYEMAQQLRTLGCEYGQGYYFSRPLDPGAATALMQSRPQWQEKGLIAQLSEA